MRDQPQQQQNQKKVHNDREKKQFRALLLFAFGRRGAGAQAIVSWWLFMHILGPTSQKTRAAAAIALTCLCVCVCICSTGVFGKCGELKM